MADNTTKFTIQGVVDVKQVLTGIDEIKKALGKLALGPEVQANFNRLFQNVERQAEKANNAMASGFKNKGDVKNYTDAMNQITRSYEDIIKKIEILKSKNNTPLIKDSTDFKTITDKINTLEKDLQKLQNTAQKVSAGFAESQKQLALGVRTITAAPDFQVSQWKKIKDNFSETNVNIEKVKEALIELEKQYNKADAKGSTQGVNAEKWERYAANVALIKDKVREYEEALNKKNTAESNAATVENNLINAQTQLNTILAEAVVEFDAAGNAAKQDAQNFREYSQAAGSSAKSTQAINSELEHFKSRAAYFFGITNAINLFKRAVRSAYSTVKDLDAVMTETAVVTDFSVGDMWTQLPEYTQRANELGVTIHDTYEAATLFYQQGLKTNEVMQISNETLKMARIAGLDAATASDRMTNALRGFNMELDKVSAQRVNDVYSKLAAITASNTDEISTAMTKVASLAHNANMEFETTAAFLAQIIESTRESAETAGTALKTVVARFSEVKKLYSKGELLGQDEEGEEIDVNKVSTALRSAGINLNEYLTGAKGLDDIFMELAEKWDSLDQVQQRYIATMAAGSRQQSRFIALMSDYKRTTELVNAANNANGASQEQYAKTLESLQTKLARLKNAWNEFILGLANSDAIKGAVDLLTNLITAINNLIKAISGKNAGVKMITTFLTAFTSFKIGASLVGKTALGGFFKSLVVDSQGQAAVGARAIAKNFYANLANNIVNYKNRGGIASSARNGFLDFRNYFSASSEEMWTYIDQKAGITQLYDSGKITKDQVDTISNAFHDGTYSVEEFNQVLKNNNVQYQLTTEDAAKLGIAMRNNNGIMRSTVNEWKTFAAVNMAAGSAMMLFGNMLEQSDNELLQNFGKTLKVVGGGLTVFGTLMSVWLPLQAQIGAKGISAAIDSIPIVGWIALVITLITALGVALYNLAQSNSAEASLAKAAEASKAAADAANEAKEAYEKLGEAWDSLDEKYDAIENAVKGTQEWRDAIRQVNDAVIELMGTYDGIEVSRDENGILHITNQDEVDDKLKNIALNAEANSRFAKIAELNWAQQVNDDKVFGGITSPGRERYAGAIEDLKADNKLLTADDKEIKEYLERSFEKQNVNIDADQYVDDVRAYINDYKKNQIAVDSQKAALGSTILSNTGLDPELQKYANSLLNSNYIDQIKNINTVNAEGLLEEDLKREFAQARGYIDYTTYKSNNPDEKVSTEDMQREVAAARTVEDASNRLITFTSNLDKLDEAEKAFFAGQEGSALTRAQINRFTSESIGYDPAKLYEELGGDAVYGEGGLANFVSQFYSDLEIAANRFDTSRFSDVFVDNLNTNLTDNLQSGAFETFTNNLWSVYLTSGKEGMDKIQSSIREMTKDMEPDEIEKFINSINAVDWASADSVRTLDDLAKEFGVSEDAIEDFKNQIIDLNNAATSIDLDKLSSALGIIKKIESGEQGRSFSEEDYNILTAQGVSKSDFKYNVETGNYDYIGQNLQDISTSVKDYLNTATSQLEKGIITKDVVDSIKGNYDENIRDDEGALGRFLHEYKEKAGSDSLIQAIPYGDLEQMQQAYDKVMEAANSANEEELDRIRDRQYQIYSGAENAAGFEQGDDLAGDALKQKIINSGIPQAFIDSLYEEIENGEGTNAGNVVDTITAAKGYGIDVETLNQYVATLQEIEGLEDAQLSTLYELALANEMYQDGFKKVTDTYDEWIELRKEDGSIQPPADGNRELLKTYNQLTKDLGEMYRVSESVTNEFLNMPEAAEILEGVIEGDTEAAAQLREELAKIQLVQLGIDSESELGSQIFGLVDDIMSQASTLEFGATLETSSAMQALADLLQAAGYTSEQMQQIFNAFGWSPEMDTERVPVDSVIASNTTGYQEIVHPDGSKEVVPIDGITEFAEDGYITVPVIGNATFTPPEMPSYTPKTSNSGGGGGGSEKKPSYWKNPYDELYNLQERINEALRTREALERRYQKLLKQEQATLKDIRKSYYDQIKNLRMEADLQKQFAAGRLRQIQNVGNELYTDEDGDRTSFRSLGVTKYASYDTETGLIQIDWEGLEEIANDSDREEEGKAAEAYISKLEELVSSYEEVRDKLWDIEDKIEELRDAAIDSYLSFEDRVMEAVVGKYQREIDSYQAMSDAIEKANNEVLDSLREQIDLSRQIRDNTKKEDEISDMENRLAYLQRDTSGANQLEILKLQKDIENARESYTDTLVDQAIDKMQSDADLAAEQRAKQIEIMQAQLDMAKENGKLWQEVHDVINAAGVDGGALSPYSELIRLMEENESFKSLSAIGQQKWLEQAAEEFHKAWVGIEEAEDKYGVDANDDGTIASSGTQSALNEVSQAPISSWFSNSSSSSSSEPDYDEKTKYGVALAVCDGYWGNGSERADLLEEKGFDYDEIQGIVNDIFWSTTSGAWYGKYYGITDISDYKPWCFKTGGLADFTGPAWLDGTKAKPELVLNAQDTANFIALKDILASLLSAQGFANNTQKGGDNYFDIDINAQLEGDYDVDKLTEKIKHDIYNDGQYRNVNTLNYLR